MVGAGGPGGPGGGSPSRGDLDPHQVGTWPSPAAVAAAAWSSVPAENPQYSVNSVTLPGFTNSADTEAAALSGD